MTHDTANAINNLLSEIINSNEKCSNCKFFHWTKNWTGICFFAYGCVTDNFKYFKGGEDDAE